MFGGFPPAQKESELLIREKKPNSDQWGKRLFIIIPLKTQSLVTSSVYQTKTTSNSQLWSLHKQLPILNFCTRESKINLSLQKSLAGFPQPLPWCFYLIEIKSLSQQKELLSYTNMKEEGFTNKKGLMRVEKFSASSFPKTFYHTSCKQCFRWVLS